MKTNNSKQMVNICRNNGFSLVEMLVASLVGIIILGGVMATYTNTRDTQQISEDQINQVADARFAIDVLNYDLRHAGMYGRNNNPRQTKCYFGDAQCSSPLPAAVSDCAIGWYLNFVQPVFGSEGVNPYGSCPITAQKAGTDVLVVRYADPNPILTGDLADNTVYVRSNFEVGEVFIGDSTNEPTLRAYDDASSTLSSNHLLVARAYYISDFTDDPTDNLPSLRRVSLIPGPEVQDQLILPGVQNLQVQYGIDTLPNDGNDVIDQYVNADLVTDWSRVYAIRVWVVVRSRRQDFEVNTGVSLNIAGQAVPYPNDGYRRMVVSSVINLRNMVQVDQVP